jgi:8-oxo-dGTP pyrophosphatase MutT (NUDIX family)
MKEHVALVIKNFSGEILFIQRSFKKKSLPGAWSFASGTVEEGEEYFQTAKREAMEELGVEIKPIKIITVT